MGAAVTTRPKIAAGYSQTDNRRSPRCYIADEDFVRVSA